MSSRIEQLIDEIEEYIDSCKYQPLSNSKIIVNKEELEELNHLRMRFVEKLTPLHTVLKKRKKTVKEITLAVYEYLVQEKIQEQLAELEQKFQEDGELALAKDVPRVCRKISRTGEGICTDLSYCSGIIR